MKIKITVNEALGLHHVSISRQDQNNPQTCVAWYKEKSNADDLAYELDRVFGLNGVETELVGVDN